MWGERPASEARPPERRSELAGRRRKGRLGQRSDTTGWHYGSEPQSRPRLFATSTLTALPLTNVLRVAAPRVWEPQGWGVGRSRSLLGWTKVNWATLDHRHHLAQILGELGADP